MDSFYSQPLAICGIGCRFPGGVDDSSSFWDLLTEGRDGIVPVPQDRWSSSKFFDPDVRIPSKMYVNAGGFIDQNINEFDAEFFGISPREASRLDPQQRILLEITWEALEDAGISLSDIVGTSTGVFVGGFMADNLLTQLNPLNRDMIGAHSEIGSTLGILSNRISHFLDLQGPSMTVDTACSSSLTAFHLACQSLRSFECDTALAAGVNIMIRPENHIALSKGGFLAKDGRCKSFDERGDGYGRGEGAGIVVLKRLNDAIRDNDNIISVVRGTSVNQDGHTDGITVPSGEAQTSLIRKVYGLSHVDPIKIGYIEAHGTGTKVGDPIEANALGNAIGVYRASENPAYIGSVKSNIGHLEAAAGIAGIIKASLALKHGIVPKLANLKNPNPNIPFEKMGLRLPIDNIEMREPKGERYYAVNSFGYGGSNAHALLQDWVESKAHPQDHSASPSFKYLPLSARNEKALRQLAERYSDILTEANVNDVCHTASCRRSHLEYRLAVFGNNASDLEQQLKAYAAGNDQDIIAGKTAFKPKKPVFVLTGMGPQWWAMGRELYQSEPVFRSTVTTIDEVFETFAGWSIRHEMLAGETESRMARTEVAQPANFVLQVALVELYKSWGVKPAAIVGHSVGEVAVAYLCGALSLNEAVQVSFHRSQLQQRLAGKGGMLALGATEEQATSMINGYSDVVSIAAINSDKSIVLAGNVDALQAIAGQAEKEGIFNRFLKVEVPYHSPVMDEIKSDLLSMLHHLGPKLPQMPTWSTVTGMKVNEINFDGDYFYENVRQPVRLAAALSDLMNAGFESFIEIGPHPVLSNAIQECAASLGKTVSVVSSLHRDKPELETLRRAFSQLYVNGTTIDWRASCLSEGNKIDLPHYPWQREEYWEEAQTAASDRLEPLTHPLVGFEMPTAVKGWQNDLGGVKQTYINEHKVDDLVIFPGAGYIEIGLAIHSRLDERNLKEILNVKFGKALVVNTHEGTKIQVFYDKETSSCKIFGWDEASEQWTLHASMELGFDVQSENHKQINLSELKSKIIHEIDGLKHYKIMSSRGLNYGSAFQGVKKAWLGENLCSSLVKVEVPPEIQSDIKDYFLHPAVLDASFQSILQTIENPANRDLYLPVSVDRVLFYNKPESLLYAYATRTETDGRTLKGDIILVNENGEICASFHGMVIQAITDKIAQANNALDDKLFGLKWVEAARLPQAEAGKHVLIGRGGAAFEAIRKSFDTKVENFSIIIETNMVAAIDAYNSLVANDINSEIKSVSLMWGSEDKKDICGIEQCSEMLMFLQNSLKHHSKKKIIINILTSDAQQTKDELSEQQLSSAATVAISRVAIAEQQILPIRNVDLTIDQLSIERAITECISSISDDDIAHRSEGRFVRRLTQIAKSKYTRENTFKIDGDKTYLITGGLGGFGLETAKWLVSKGAKHLVLVGRSHKNTSDVLDELTILKASGAEVEIMTADMSDFDQVKSLMSSIQSRDHRLAGIFHAAGVLDDNPIDSLQKSQIENVMMPKAVGAWNLHLATANIPLDHFIMFSSISSLVGTPGQGSYVAANAFLDALAIYRSAQGLAGTAINWGVIGAVGMAARKKELLGYLTGTGFDKMHPQEALSGLDTAIELGVSNIGIANMNWHSFAPLYPSWAASKRNEEITKLIDFTAGHQSSSSEERGFFKDIEHLQDRFVQIISNVLHVEKDRIDLGKSLISIGLDSILAIEMQAKIEADLRLKLSVLDLLRGVSIRELVDKLFASVDHLQSDEAEGNSSSSKTDELINIEDIDAYLDNLSDAEVALILEGKVSVETGARS